MAGHWRTSAGIWTMVLGLVLVSELLTSSSGEPHLLDLSTPGTDLNPHLFNLKSSLPFLQSSDKLSFRSLDSSSVDQLSLRSSDSVNPSDLSRPSLRSSDSDLLWFRSTSGGAPVRKRRNILFPNGVKLCNKETYEQVAANHLQYFHLRVCQETVWEAYKVFWDQIPDRDQFRSWVNRCLDGSVSVRDIGLFFSSSQEHRDLINNRLASASAVNNSKPATTEPGESPTETSPVEEVTVVQVPASIIPDTTRTVLNQDVDTRTSQSSSQSPDQDPAELQTIIFQEEISQIFLTSPKPTTILPQESKDVEEDTTVFTLQPEYDTKPEIIPAQSVTETSLPSKFSEAATQAKHELETTPKLIIEERPLEETKMEEDNFLQTEIPDSEMETTTTHKKVEEEPTKPDIIDKMEDITENIGHVTTTKTIIDEIDEELTFSEEITTKDEIILEIEPTMEEEHEIEMVPTIAMTVEAIFEKSTVKPGTEEDKMVEEPSVEEELSLAPGQEDKQFQGSHDFIEKYAELVEITTISTAKPDKEEDKMVDEPSVEVELLFEPSPEKDGMQGSQDLIEKDDEALVDVGSLATEQPTTGESQVRDVQEVTPVISNTSEETTVREEEKMVKTTTYKPTQEGSDLEEKDVEEVTPTILVVSEDLTKETEEIMEDPKVIESPKVEPSEEPAEILPTEAEKLDKLNPSLSPSEESPDQDGHQTEKVEQVRTERPVKPEQTVKYVVEYNNGNFPDPTEPSLDVDDNLFKNNGFGLDEDEDTLGNEIGASILRPLRPLKDQVLELSLRLREESYTDALRNPSSLQYQRLERVFIKKIIDAFERLPGLKNIQVVEFRPQKDLEHGLVVSVHYAVTLEVDSGGVSNDTLDFIALQSNFVEKNYPRSEQPTVLYTITDFRNYITEALHRDIQQNGNLLPSVKPTTQPADDFDNMDNILAAEKPPDAPTHEGEHPEVEDSKGFLTKDDFLFDAFDLVKPQGTELRVSENDVLTLDESTAAPETQEDLKLHQEDQIEHEGFLTIADQDSNPQPSADVSDEDTSGSGFSGDGPVQLYSDLISTNLSPTNSETLPPPDLETTDDDAEDEIPTVVSIEASQLPPKTQDLTPVDRSHEKDGEFEPTKPQILPKVEIMVEKSESTEKVVPTTEIVKLVDDFEPTKEYMGPKVEEISQIMIESEIETVSEVVQNAKTFTSEPLAFTTAGTITFEGPNSYISETRNDFFITLQPFSEVPELEIETEKISTETGEGEFEDILEVKKSTNKPTTTEIELDFEITESSTKDLSIEGENLDLGEKEIVTKLPTIEQDLEGKAELIETPRIEEPTTMVEIATTEQNDIELEQDTTTTFLEVEHSTSNSELMDKDITLEAKELEEETPTEQTLGDKMEGGGADKLKPDLVDSEFFPPEQLEKSEIPEIVSSDHKDVEVLEEQHLGVTEKAIIKTTVSGLASEDLSVDEVIAVTELPKTTPNTTTVSVSTSAIKIIEKELPDFEVKNQNEPDAIPTYSVQSEKTTIMAPQTVTEATSKSPEKEDLNIIKLETSTKPIIAATKADNIYIFESTKPPSVETLKTTTTSPQTTKMAATTSSPTVLILEPEKDSPFTRISDSVPEYEDETPVSTPTLTTETQENIKTTQGDLNIDVFTETTTQSVIFDKTEVIITTTAAKVVTTESKMAEYDVTLVPTVESIEKIPEIQTSLTTSPITISQFTSLATTESTIHQETSQTLAPVKAEQEKTEHYQVEDITTINPAVKWESLGPNQVEDGSGLDFETVTSQIIITQMPTDKMQVEEVKMAKEDSETSTEIQDLKPEMPPTSPSVEDVVLILSKDVEESTTVTTDSKMAVGVDKIETDLPIIQTLENEVLNEVGLSTRSGVEVEMLTLSKIVETLPTLAPNIEVKTVSSFETVPPVVQKDSEVENFLPVTPSNDIEPLTLSKPVSETVQTSPTTFKDDSKITIDANNEISSTILINDLVASSQTEAPIVETLPTIIDDSKMAAEVDTSGILVAHNLTEDDLLISSKTMESLQTVSPVVATNVNKVEIVSILTTTPSVELTAPSKSDATIGDTLPTAKGDTKISAKENVSTVPTSIEPLPETESPIVETLPITPKDGSKIAISSQTPSVEPKTEEAVSKMATNVNNSVSIFSQGFSDSASFDVSFDLFPEEDAEGSSGFSSLGIPGLIPDSHSSLRPIPGKALTVFFKLRVTNMVFSTNLFNKSSSEYRKLEQRFIQLLVPFLESNLNNFQDLEILNFRNGSVVVNSRMRFVKPVRRGLTTAVYLVLKDFASSAHRTWDLSIDKASLDVQSGERADPCKFSDCNQFSRCRVNPWTSDPECVCDPGYISLDGLPCQSTCDVHTDYCKNDGKCDVIPGKGAICRCRVGENWFFRGEHCEEFVSEPLVVGVAVGSILGFLLVAVAILYFLSRTLRQPHESCDTGDPIGVESVKPEDSDDSVMPQSYRRYDDLPPYHCYYDNEPLPPTCGHCDSYPPPSHHDTHLQQATPPHLGPTPPPSYSSAISREEMSERMRILQLCSRDQAFNDFIQTTLFLERRGSSTT